VGIGLALAVGGAILGWFWVKIYPRIEGRLELGANARLARIFNRFDRWYKTRGKIREVWTQKGTEGMIYSANANPVFVAPVEQLPSPPPPSPGPDNGVTPPEGGGAASTAGSIPPEAPEPVPTPPDASALIPEVGQTSDKQEKPVPTPTSEVEAALGEPAAIEPTNEELRAQEEERKASMPPPPQPITVTVVNQPAPEVKAPAGRYRGNVHPRVEPTSDELFALAEYVDGSDPKRRDDYAAAAVTKAEKDERRAKKARIASGDTSDLEEEERANRHSRNRVRSMNYERAMGTIE
jgi:hypothetical protein